jgi:hypothetical protein
LEEFLKPLKMTQSELADKIGGRVCLDSLKQFLSDKLLGLISLPAF